MKDDGYDEGHEDGKRAGREEIIRDLRVLNLTIGEYVGDVYRVLADRYERGEDKQ